MSANRSISRAFRPLTAQSSSKASTSTSTQQLLSSSNRRLAAAAAAPSSYTRTASTASSTTSVATASSSSDVAASISSSSYVHDPTPHVHLPRLARTEPELYAAVRPPPLSAFAALTARLGLISNNVDAETRDRRIKLVYQACTHPSFQALVDRANTQLDVSGLEKKEGSSPLDVAQYIATGAKEDVEHNAALATVGNSLLGMLATEFLHLRYPNLPTRVLKAAVSAYVGPTTLSDVGAELGLSGQGILRWNKEARVPTGSNLNAKRGNSRGKEVRTLFSRDVASESMRALIAVIFQEQGLSATRNFVISHFLNRSLNLAGLLKFGDPKRALAHTCAKYGKQPPQSRMVAESGRLSISPIFVVGVWSGVTKIGEGSGSSIRMAEFRAAEDALRRLYMAETPLGEFDLPSCTLDAQFAGVGSSEGGQQGAMYNAQPIGETEVLVAAGKSRQ